jgi:hypothetical protein
MTMPDVMLPILSIDAVKLCSVQTARVILARIYIRKRLLASPSLVGIVNSLLHLNLRSLERLAVYLPVSSVVSGVVAALALHKDQRLQRLTVSKQ